MEKLRANKIDLNTIRLATLSIPAFMEATDGLIPEETKDMVIAEGKGKFLGSTLVEIGELDRSTGTFRGRVYRQHLTYRGFRKGRDIYIDPVDLSPKPDKRGLWIKLEDLGTVVENNHH